MSDSPAVNLERQAGGFCLVIERQPAISLSPEAFAHLARQFVKQAHELREPLEPPYVVGLAAHYNVDGDQRSSVYREAWAFATPQQAREFLELAQADVRRFDIQWPFDLYLPAVPELNFWWREGLTDPVTALAEFRVVCFEHFFAEAGLQFWESLPVADRERMWPIWTAGEGLGGFDRAELEAWVAGTQELLDW